jgi:hypothetical protein
MTKGFIFPFIHLFQIPQLEGGEAVFRPKGPTFSSLKATNHNEVIKNVTDFMHIVWCNGWDDD